MTIAEVPGTKISSAPKGLINARITYKNAPIHVLEKFCFKDLEQAYQTFLTAGYSECVLIQTCNRVEVFASSDGPDGQSLLETWSKHVGLSPKDFADVQISEGSDAISHLIRLSSGLESLVVGEDQILGQVRRAFEFARSNSFAGQILSPVFERALKAGSRIRKATGINKGNVSVASISLNIAEEYFDDLHEREIMLIGTGEAATLVAKLLRIRGIEFIISSRTFERAKWFSETIAGKPLEFDDALEELNNVDLVFVATTAPYLLVTRDRIDAAMKNRSNRGMMIFDLSNPRTVDERVQTVQGVKLVTMDQIAELAGKNLRMRMNEYNTAEELVRQELRSVDSTLKRLKAEPSIVSIFKSVDSIRQRELNKALNVLEKDKMLSDKESKTIEELSHAIVEGILSVPMNNLRRQIAEGKLSNDELVHLVAALFSYEEDQQNSH